MQINELVNESGNVNEAQPMGFLNKLGNKALQGTGNLINKATGIMPNFGAQAAGRLNVGALANQVMAGYQKLLGQTGEPPTETSLLNYLKKQGYPIDNAKQVLAQAIEKPAADDVQAPTPGPETGTEPKLDPNAPLAPAPVTAGESIRRLMNLLNEGPMDPLDMKIVAKAIQAAAQQHAGAQVQQAPQADPTDVQAPGQTPAQIRNAAAPTSNEKDSANNQQDTNPNAAKTINAQAGNQAVDNAIKTIKAVDPTEQPAVIDYAGSELEKLRANAGIPPAAQGEPANQGSTLDLDQYRADQAAKKVASETPGWQQTKYNGGGTAKT